jgi:hypothetical protein
MGGWRNRHAVTLRVCDGSKWHNEGIIVKSDECPLGKKHACEILKDKKSVCKCQYVHSIHQTQNPHGGLAVLCNY